MIDKPSKKPDREPGRKPPDEIRDFLLADTTREIREILPTFLDADTSQEPVRTCLTAFVNRALRFARLERIFQGDVLFDLPVHQAVLLEDFGEDPEKEGELLAEEERQILEESSVLLEELPDALDTRGIKVIPVPSPIYAAGLLFRESSGPAILVTRSPDTHEGRDAVAHAYGHLVADVSPYKNRFCRLGEDLQPTVEERRADSFAQTLLAPVRLLPDDSRGEEPELHMPPRYLNLVLAAYTKGFVDNKGLEVLLEATKEQVRDLLSWAREQKWDTSTGSSGSG